DRLELDLALSQRQLLRVELRDERVEHLVDLRLERRGHLERAVEDRLEARVHVLVPANRREARGQLLPVRRVRREHAVLVLAELRREVDERLAPAAALLVGEL